MLFTVFSKNEVFGKGKGTNVVFVKGKGNGSSGLGKPCITNLKRISKPGLRVYTNHKEIPKNSWWYGYYYSIYFSRINDRS